MASILSALRIKRITIKKSEIAKHYPCDGKPILSTINLKVTDFIDGTIYFNKNTALK